MNVEIRHEVRVQGTTSHVLTVNVQDGARLTHVVLCSGDGLGRGDFDASDPADVIRAVMERLGHSIEYKGPYRD